MPNIKPVTDLEHYSDLLRDVSFGSPVFLTKDGRGCYAILDIKEYERMNATLRLTGELETGKRSGEEQGWLSAGEVRSRFHE
ncbi:MAG: type II toxin-antitoxin system prevent-host-death family antitoxin [Synergistaceae bacterium]|nr:type II toxin-antitoxin system prevent-host-death family antitoxin [Synergistaceae bacterium]